MDLKELQLLAQPWQIDDVRLEGQFIVFGYRHPEKIHRLAKLCGADLRVVDDRYAYLPLKTAEHADMELVGLVKSVLQPS